MPTTRVNAMAWKRLFGTIVRESIGSSDHLLITSTGAIIASTLDATPLVYKAGSDQLPCVFVGIPAVALSNFLSSDRVRRY
jgi:ABC-type Fe3+ transport system permease subunit